MKLLWIFVGAFFFLCHVNLGFSKDLTVQRDLERSEHFLEEVEFASIISSILDLYQPIAETRGRGLYLRAPLDLEFTDNIHDEDTTEVKDGRKLVLEALWDIDIPNAHATMDMQDDLWYLSVFGGLARLELMVPESLALITCHEIGHFFAGFPLYKISPFTGVYVLPLSSEGQADYYSTQVCLKYLWQGEDNRFNKQGVPYHTLIPTLGKEKCDSQYKQKDHQSTCYKMMYAGLQTSWVWHEKSGWFGSRPDILTPSMDVVEETNQQFYPDPQCRLDTYIQGALCPVEFILQDSEVDSFSVIIDFSLIPGVDHPEGPDDINARDASRLINCGVEQFQEASRPSCWFQPDFYSDTGYSPFL